MFAIIMGACAFLLFFLYDVNSIKFKRKAFHKCFFIGFLLLIFATAEIVVSTRDIIEINLFRMMMFGVFAVLFLCLLIYTLFFALPFQETYIETDGSLKVYQNGVYALCRHPGVLWFIGFYMSLGIAINIKTFYIVAFIFSILNIIYIIFQDNWTFMKQFDNYNQYKENTPFLIPNRKSMKRCLETL